MSMLERAVQIAARAASITTPIADALIPEKLEVDDNTSLWAQYTPDYVAGEPLRQNISVDFAIIWWWFHRHIDSLSHEQTLS
jgi:hypothetical protein